MALIEDIFNLINMRSFSSLWFWIVVAVYWSAATRTVLGAPHDMILRARKGDAESVEDMHALVGVYVRRKLRFTRQAGHWAVGFYAAMMTVILILAVRYRLELAQALLLLFVPMMFVRLLSLRLAFKIERMNLEARALSRALLTHRFWVQLIGIVSIFVTAVWGMMFVMSRSVLGL